MRHLPTALLAAVFSLSAVAEPAVAAEVPDSEPMLEVSGDCIFC